MMITSLKCSYATQLHISVHNIFLNLLSSLTSIIEIKPSFTSLIFSKYLPRLCPFLYPTLNVWISLKIATIFLLKFKILKSPCVKDKCIEVIICLNIFIVIQIEHSLVVFIKILMRSKKSRLLQVDNAMIVNSLNSCQNTYPLALQYVLILGCSLETLLWL